MRLPLDGASVLITTLSYWMEDLMDIVEDLHKDALTVEDSYGLGEMQADDSL